MKSIKYIPDKSLLELRIVKDNVTTLVLTAKVQFREDVNMIIDAIGWHDVTIEEEQSVYGLLKSMSRFGA